MTTIAIIIGCALAATAFVAACAFIISGRLSRMEDEAHAAQLRIERDRERQAARKFAEDLTREKLRIDRNGGAK